MSAAFAVLMTAGILPAQAAPDRSTAFLDRVEAFSSTFSDIVFVQINILSTPVEVIVLWLAAPMVIFTVYFGFINLRCFKLAYKILRGCYRDPEAPGEVSQFQALSTALSGTVGLGNIAGVAIAISIGGPGAALWMVIIAFFAMTLKFFECTMAVKYRVLHDNGTVSGGPMYYLKLGLEARGWSKLGQILAATYAVFAVFSILQLGQVNQAYSQINLVTGLDSPWLFGIMLAALTGLVIFGGLRSIVRVTSRLVPFMCALYIIASLIIIVSHYADIPQAIATIVTGAMAPDGVVGGIIGVFVIGMRRAVYSTESGIGSAAMAHAAAKTNEPVSEGMVALLEPFIDTIVVSTMTALVIVITGAYQIDGLRDIQMTSAAYGSVFSWFPYILAVLVFLFAFSTIISWGYYISKVWEYLFGRSRLSRSAFRSIYCLALIPGGALSIHQIIDIIDSFFFLMAVPNIIGLYLLAPELKKDLADYLRRIKSGEIRQCEPIRLTRNSFSLNL